MTYIDEIWEEILEKKPVILKKRVKIIFDDRQYTIRIPKSFAEKVQLDVKKKEFEFTLDIKQKRLSGELIEKSEL